MLRVLPLIAVAVPTLVVMITVVGTDRLVAVLTTSDARLLLGAVALQILSLLCFANLYRTTYRAVRGDRAADAGANAGTVALAAFGLTQALPGGGVAGGALAMRRLQQLGSSALQAANSVVHIGLLSLTGLCLVVTVTIGTAAITTGRHTGLAGTGLLLCGLLVGGFLLAQRTGADERLQRVLLTQVTALLARLPRGPGSPLEPVPDHAGTTAPLLPLGVLLRPLTWSLGKWALDLTVLTLVIRAVGGTASLAAIAVAYAAANLLNSIPVTPGGLGLVEGGLSASLIAAGLDLGTAAAATLAYRAVSYWLPLAASVPAALHHLAAARVPTRSIARPVEPLHRGTSDPALLLPEAVA